MRAAGGKEVKDYVYATGTTYREEGIEEGAPEVNEDFRQCLPNVEKTRTLPINRPTKE